MLRRCREDVGKVFAKMLGKCRESLGNMFGNIIEGSLEVKLPTIWTDGKAEVGRVREERRRREKIRKRKVTRKMQVREKVEKSRNNVFFPMICVSGGSKRRLAKAAGAEPSGQMRDEKLHAIVARSTFPSQMYKAHHSRSTFGS